MNAPWRIEMLGRFLARQGDLTISRFESRRAGALLAYLALRPGRMVARETLIDLLWPDADFDTGRNRFKQALASLRRQLEPPGTPWGAVLVADRATVGLNASAVITDVAELETALARAHRVRATGAEVRFLAAAVAAYSGELLPGYYDPWILAERDRLGSAHRAAVQRLAAAAQDLLDRETAAALTNIALGALNEVSPGSLSHLQQLAKQLATGSHRSEFPPKTERETFSEPRAAQMSGVFPARLPLQFTRFFGREEELARLHALLSESVRKDTVPLPAKTPPQPSTSQGEGAALTPAPSPTLRERGATSPRPSTSQGAGVPSGSPPAYERGGRGEVPNAQRLTPNPRLITLTGPAGSGKTRLAIEAARRASEDFAEAVWFVALADLTDARLLPATIADALHLPRSAQAEPLHQIAEFLNERSAPALLVLDNFEQLAEAGALTLWNLLHRVPWLTCLVTSRRRLALPGEALFPVAPLPLPLGPETPASLMECASVQLFADRVRAARPDFQVTARNAPQVAALCQALEGVPLAIELAASRASMFTPAQMLEQLQHRFTLLTTRRMDKASRHRSLWAAIAWSYDLLSPELQRFFRGLSVFRGGWNIAAAQAVCAEPRALDYLTQLRGHSLIVLEEGREEMRFRLLDSLREFAAEQSSPQERSELAQRHIDHYRHLAEAAERELQGPAQLTWLERLEQERDNLRAALTAALAADPAGKALPLAVALGRFWQVRAPFGEGRQWLEAALMRAPARTSGRARALYFAGDLANIQGDGEQAAAWLEESLAISRELGDSEGVANALHTLGIIAFYRLEYARALPLQQEALTLRKELGNRWNISQSLNGMGLLTWRFLGDPARAGALLEEAVQIAREIGDRRILSYYLYNLGNLFKEAGDFGRANTLLQESLALCQELDDRSFHAQLIQNLGSMAELQGDYVQAAAFYTESLAFSQQASDRRAASFALWGLATVAHACRDFARAVCCLAACERLLESIHLPMDDADRAFHARCLADARAALGEKKTEALWQQGEAMTMEAALAYLRTRGGRKKMRKK